MLMYVTSRTKKTVQALVCHIIGIFECDSGSVKCSAEMYFPSHTAVSNVSGLISDQCSNELFIPVINNGN